MSSKPIEMIQLIHGDAIEEMKKIPDGFIDLTVTSPPYDNLRTYNDSLEWGDHIWKPIIEGLFRVTKPGGVVVWIVGDATIRGSETGTSFKQALYFMECGFNLHDTMIWEKPNYAPLYPSVKRYDFNFEYMFIFSKGQPQSWNPIKDKVKAESSKQRGKYRTSYINADGSKTYKEKTENGKDFSKRNSIWKIPNGQKRGIGHPAPFPEQLAHDHIISWSNEGDTVLDPFMGSGTTGKMARKLNRKFIGIEKVEKYYNIAKDRIDP